MGQIRCVIYCRVSTSDQNCDRQELDLLAYAARCGYQVVGIYKETASGSKNDRQERKKVCQLARDRQIDVILCTELTRWGRSLPDLIESLNDLHSWSVSLIAQTGMQFDLATPHGKLIAGIMGSFAEFEKDLLKERVKSGIAAARSRGKKLGRPQGGKTSDNCQRIKKLRAEGLSLRAIGQKLGLSKSSVERALIP
jgi:putative DNA-invertase from lambdoid prophage Rac